MSDTALRAGPVAAWRGGLGEPFDLLKAGKLMAILLGKDVLGSSSNGRRE